MKLLMEKWYLDFSCPPHDFGFYYIMRITLGPFRFGFSGINHFGKSCSVQSFRFSRVKQSGFHTLDLGHARLVQNQREMELFIRHGGFTLKGRWRRPPTSGLRPSRTLYENAHGRCDWNVWCPKADVRLMLQIHGQGNWVQGTAYVDFVRTSFPAGKVPFHTLYWGRIHNEKSWGVFLALRTPEKKISWYLTPGAAVNNLEVCLNRDAGGCVRNMDWFMPEAGPDTSLRCKIIRVLESQEVLNRGWLLRLLPPRLRQRLSSGLWDEKYAVVSESGGQQSFGIMEEVRWHDF